ncbi:MAG: NYN domain-containing protein [Kiritimatiellae bacterium]|nr:NYN domain-containing protein [Kiritimatiellia bacterium]
MNDDNDIRLAVLIDAENASRKDMKAVMEEIARYGRATIKRAFGDWVSLAGWKQTLLDLAINPVQQYAYTTGKNATDAAMVINAMDILHDGDVEGFVLVSSDSDFTPLVMRLRESGRKVIGVGELKTPKPFIRACDKFIYTENLQPAAEESPGAAKPAAAKAESGTAENAQQSAPVAKKPISAKTVRLIAESIKEIAGDDGKCLMGALANLIYKKQPDFDPRSYGFSRLSKMLKSIDRFEVVIDGTHSTVKDKKEKG